MPNYSSFKVLHCSLALQIIVNNDLKQPQYGKNPLWFANVYKLTEYNIEYTVIQCLCQRPLWFRC